MFGLFKGKTPIEWSAMAGNPHSEAGLKAILAHDWATIDALYAQQNASDRYDWISILCDEFPLDYDFPDNLSSAASLTVLGGLYVGLAKRVRGAGMASSVSSDAIQKMFAAAKEAYGALSKASEIAPQDSVPIAIHLRAAVAASDSSDTVFDLVERLHQTTETTLFGPLNYMTHQLEKWMGSQEDMWRLAHHYTENAPNPAWHALKAYAMIEDWLWYVAFTDDEDLKKFYSDKRASGELKQEIDDLDAAFWNGLSTFTGELPISEKRFAHNHLAYVNYYLGDEKKALPHVEALGTYPSPMPWSYRMGTSKDLMKYWNKIRKSLDLDGFYQP